MTQSEFETLRTDLRALRADMDMRLSAVETRLSGVEKNVMRIEAKVDEKPGTLVIYQAALTMMTGMFAVMFGTAITLKAWGFFG